MPPPTSALARGLFWRALSLLVGQGSWYASLLVLAILLPPRDFGIVAVSSAVVSITTLLIESGTTGAIVVNPSLDAASVRRSVRRTALIGTAFTLAVILLARPLVSTFAAGSDPAVLRAIILTVALAAFSIVPTALLNRALMFKRLSIITMVAAVVASGAAIGAAALGAGVWSLAIRLILYQLLLTMFMWLGAAKLVPRGPRREKPPRQRGVATGFLLVSLATFIAETFDNLLVGAFTNVAQLGLYALAFSLAFAPLTQISWTVGGVLFPAIAATRDAAMVLNRTLKALRLMALLLLPQVPVAIALAPGVIVSVLGRKWSGMVLPFQILIVAGVGQGLLNVLSETLSGSGGIGLRARIDVVWALSTAGAIVLAIQAAGIRGAAAAHVLTFTLTAMAYIWWGGRRLGLSPSGLLEPIRGVVLSVAVQAVVTAVVTVGIEQLSGGHLLAGALGAAVGVAALAATLAGLAPELLREGRNTVAAALRPRPA